MQPDKHAKIGVFFQDYGFCEWEEIIKISELPIFFCILILISQKVQFKVNHNYSLTILHFHSGGKGHGLILGDFLLTEGVLLGYRA